MQFSVSISAWNQAVLYAWIGNS